MLDKALFHSIPRFAKISDPPLGFLCERGMLLNAKQGETIFLEGDPCSHFQMVFGGEVKIYKVLESGREIILVIFRTCDSIGEVHILVGGEYPASSMALKPTTILKLNRP